MSDEQIETMIKEQGADKAPRVTPADIEANIASEDYFTADAAVFGKPKRVGFRRTNGKYIPIFEDARHQALSLLTFCVLTLKNGFTVTGESACASPENFDAEIGRRIARENAVQKIWSLMGYELRSKLAAGSVAAKQ